jgi:hypothetical protein
MRCYRDGTCSWDVLQARARAADRGVFLLLREDFNASLAHAPSLVGGGGLRFYRCWCQGTCSWDVLQAHARAADEGVFLLFSVDPLSAPDRGGGGCGIAGATVDGCPPPPTYKGWLCFVMQSFIVLECGLYLSLAVVSLVA